MSQAEHVMLWISTGALGLVVMIFGFAAPWYRTWAGRILFGLHFCLLAFLVDILLREYGAPSRIVEPLEAALFPLATVVTLAHLALMIGTQLSRVRERTAQLLFRKDPTPAPVWDGTERRRANLKD